MNGNKITVTEVDLELRKKIVKARPDPRDQGSIKRSKKDFIDDKRSDSPGRIAIARMLLWTRQDVLNLALKKFGSLVAEDQRRRLILNGEDPKNVNDFKDLSPVTIMRIEDATGTKGADRTTLTLLAPRLYNPSEGRAFTPIELQALHQDFSKIENLEKGIYIEESRELNLSVDRELYYLTENETS